MCWVHFCSCLSLPLLVISFPIYLYNIHISRYIHTYTAIAIFLICSTFLSFFLSFLPGALPRQILQRVCGVRITPPAKSPLPFPAQKLAGLRETGISAEVGEKTKRKKSGCFLRYKWGRSFISGSSNFFFEKLIKLSVTTKYTLYNLDALQLLLYVLTPNFTYFESNHKACLISHAEAFHFWVWF